MREDSIARRYAAALFSQANKNGVLDAVEADLGGVAGGMKTIPALQELAHTLVSEERKKFLLKKELDGKVRPVTLHFLNLLVDKRRLDILPEVRDEFAQMLRFNRNIALARATSARPMTRQQTDSLKTALESKTGKTILLETDVDDTLIGGVLVRIGDTVYDGSVKGNLNRLREQLLARK